MTLSPPPTFTEALRVWLKMGLIGFGGPAGQIAIMQHELVDQRKWIGQAAFLQALNFCMLLPGPEAQQLATYMGWKFHGVKGALAAGILFVLPGALLLYGLAWIAAVYGGAAPVAAVFAGLKPVVVAIVFHAVWRIGRRVLITKSAVLIALIAFLAVQVADIAFPLVVIAAGAVGWFMAAAQRTEKQPGDLAPLPPWSRLLRMIGGYLLLLVVPVGLVVAIFGTEPFFALARFFTQAAFVTFGGAYAVLPYVADAAVNHFQWLSPSEMINGLALAETTPGPLILVLQYVGFFAGWNWALAGAAGGLSPIAAATIGAAVTSYTTFLPSIFLIVAGAPYVERLAKIKGAAGALATITAAVVGVILTLGVFFARQVIVAPGGRSFDFIAMAAILVTLAVLIRFKISLHWVVLAGALFGLARAAAEGGLS